MRHIYLIVFALLMILQACSPRPVFRMSPEAQNTTFNQGTAYVHLKQENIEVTISYYRHFSERFVMDIEIVNNTDTVLRVDPRQFSYDAYRFTSAELPWNEKDIMASAQAVNPEQELIRKDKAISRSIARQKTSTLLYAIGQTASVAHSVIEEDPKKREALSEERQERAINHEINERESELYRASLRDQREVWEVETLRKTDLFPGEYIRGYVFFNNQPEARGYLIHFDIGETNFGAYFKQKKYEVE